MLVLFYDKVVFCYHWNPNKDAKLIMHFLGSQTEKFVFIIVKILIVKTVLLMFYQQINTKNTTSKQVQDYYCYFG